jgi:type I restriction-modification system DNA methylase subunit
MKLSEICKLLHCEYMTDIDRDRKRVKATGEVFTPTPLVQEILNKFPPDKFDLDVTFLDPSCGDGQFLREVLIYKLVRYDSLNGNSGEISNEIFARALKSIYGVEYKQDNAELCRTLLLCGQTNSELLEIVKTNIVCHDALTYDYSFNGTNFTESELKQQELDRLSCFDFSELDKSIQSSEKIKKKIDIIPLDSRLWK